MRAGPYRTLRWAVPALAFGLAGCAGEYPQTMLRPVTEWGRIQIDLWAWVTYWTVPVLVLVLAVLAFILVRFRGRPGDPKPTPVYGDTRLEILWTLGPAIIILFIAVPTIRAIFATQVAPPADALHIEVIGHQWWWEFRYPELELTTANQFYVPVDRPVALHLRSADVVHSFWVPRLGGKRDVNPVVRTPPGVDPLHLNTIVVTPASAGEYPGQCAEFCGTSHAIMRMMAVAVGPDEFDAWVEVMRSPPEPRTDAAVRGREVFLRSTCIVCHAVAGTTARGVLGPNLTLMGDRFSIGAGAMASTEENLTDWILRAPEIKKAILMPGADIPAAGLPPTGLSREDAAAVAAYLMEQRR